MDQSCTSQERVLKSNLTIYDENIACAFTKISVHVIGMFEVPIVIKPKDSPKEIITHAILDGCSHRTFIKDDFVNAVEIDGQAHP